METGVGRARIASRGIKYSAANTAPWFLLARRMIHPVDCRVGSFPEAHHLAGVTAGEPAPVQSPARGDESRVICYRALSAGDEIASGLGQRAGAVCLLRSLSSGIRDASWAISGASLIRKNRKLLPARPDRMFVPDSALALSTRADQTPRNRLKTAFNFIKALPLCNNTRQRHESRQFYSPDDWNEQ